jgi:hypothetical protein
VWAPATRLYLHQRFGDSTRLILGKIKGVDPPAGHPFFGAWGTDRVRNIAFVAPPSSSASGVALGVPWGRMKGVESLVLKCD